MSKKSKFRSLAATFVTAVMVLTVGVASAFAAGNGTITVTGAENGKTYSLYKVFDATASGDNVAYTYTSKGGPDAFLTALRGQDSPFELKPASTGEYGVTLKQDKTDADVSAFLKANVANLGTPTNVAASNDSAVFKNLGVGYYYISTTIGSAVIIQSANLDVTIADKNEAPTLAKVITNATKDGGTTNLVSTDGSMAIAESGSTIAYKLTVPIKKGAVNYKIVDVMDKALTYDEASLKVMLDTEAVATDKYTVAKSVASTANTLTITFANDWLAANAESGKSIVVTYNAKFDSADHSTASVKNTAQLFYGTADDVTPEVSTEVKNASVNVVKKAESEQGKNLAGAGFVLKRADGKFYKRDAGGLSWVAMMDEATELTSNDQGQLVGGDQKVTTFHGLANGTYTLIEKTVPAGYNKADDTTVTVNANNDKGGWAESVFVRSITVANKVGSLLPSTGGMGTTLLYVGGAVLVIGAVVMLVVRRRMSENN